MSGNIRRGRPHPVVLIWRDVLNDLELSPIARLTHAWLCSIDRSPTIAEIAEGIGLPDLVAAAAVMELGYGGYMSEEYDTLFGSAIKCFTPENPDPRPLASVTMSLLNETSGV